MLSFLFDLLWFKDWLFSGWGDGELKHKILILILIIFRKKLKSEKKHIL